jgi:3-oxoacyl-[acyl-carrier protein] reductase
VDLGIAGKTALVTASSKGLGRASAEALAAEGARVTICARGAAALADAEQSLIRSGAEVLAIEADVTEPATPARLVQETVARFGGLDILVANAGGPPPGRSLEVDDAALLAALNANLLTSIRLVRESVPHMRAAGWGRICCITSYLIKQPAPNLSLSNVARTGLWAWAKTAAGDLVSEGITLNLTCPGPHATERMRELGGGGGHLADPADFGKVVAFLCSDPARDVSGVALQVDGAATTALA